MEIREKELQEIEDRMAVILRSGNNRNKVVNSASKVKCLIKRIRRRNGRSKV